MWGRFRDLGVIYKLTKFSSVFYLDFIRLDFCESVVIDEVLSVGRSVGKWYTMVYYEGLAMFFWVGVHSERIIVIERTEMLGRSKVCFMYGSNVYIVFGEEIV